MGKKLDALLGRKAFKTYKFKPLLNLAISRLAVFKNQRQVKCSQARSDVLQLLQQGHHERALLRVEHVIKEQNMLDAFIMMESYCNLLIERLHLIEQERVCPDELKEAISTLLFAASRCGDFPELQEVRAMLTAHYGKEFAGCAIELRNNCAVNLKMIHKLSTRQPVLENRIKVLKEIAAESSIVLQLEEIASISTEENYDVSKKQKQTELDTSTSSQISPDKVGKDDGFSDSMKTRKKYKDVAAAAQAAFESAAYAAEAAQAAVELSRSESHDPDDHNSPNPRRRKATDRHEPMEIESESKNEEIHGESQAAESKQGNNAEAARVMSVSSSESADEIVMVMSTSSFDEVDHVKLLEKDLVFDESDIEDSSLPHKQIPSSSQVGLEVESGHPKTYASGSGLHIRQRLNMMKGAVSARTRQVRGY